MTAIPPPVEAVVTNTAVTPGHPTTVTVSLRNRERSPRGYVLTIVGIDPEWVTGPDVVGPVPPGATVDVALVINLPSGFPASDLATSLAVQPHDLASGAPVGAAVP